MATTGIPGFFSYVYLSQLGILNYDKDDKDDKAIVLSILSFLNMGISFFAFYGITGINPLKELKIISIIPLFFVSLVISSIMTLAVYPFIINIMNKTIQSYQKEHNIANKISKSIYDLTIFNQKYKHSFVYIFDFEDKFIESGNAYMLSEKNDKIQIAISTETGRIKSKFTIEKILAEFNSKERDADSADLIVDLERKVKVFVFYS